MFSAGSRVASARLVCTSSSGSTRAPSVQYHVSRLCGFCSGKSDKFRDTVQISAVTHLRYTNPNSNSWTVPGMSEVREEGTTSVGP
eukprot:3012926-Rhodomonas_salina.2